jgi:hypothetical protein
MAGLVGLSLGWVGGLVIQSIFMVPTIYKAVFSKQPGEQQHTDADPIWLMETALLPAMGGGYAGTEPLWLMNSALQPAIGQKHAEVKPVWFLETTRLPAAKLPAQQAINRKVKKVKLESLQPYSYQSTRDRLPATDPCIEDGIMKKIYNNSTILKDEK